MTIARAFRWLLAGAAILIVLWAFAFAGTRAVRKWRTEHDRPITLTIMHWGDQAEDRVVEALIAKYKQENPRVEIIRINPGFGDFRPKLKTMMAAGTPPDLFYLPPDVLPEMAQMKLIRPIDDFIAKERASGQGTYLDDFYPILMKAWRYDTATGRVGAGPLYGLPKDFTTVLFYVNLDLFEKAGVRVPYDGWTWDEYEADMQKIRALSGKGEFADRTIYGGVLEIWPDTLRNILWTFGGDFFAARPDGSAHFRNVILDQPPAQQAMNMIRRVRLEDQSVYNATGVAKDGAQEFIAGNIGCDGPVGRWKVPRFTSDLKFRWDVVPMPYKEKRFQASQIFLTAWTMSARTKYPDECFKLAKFLCGSEGAVMQSRLGLAIPPLMSVAESKDFLEPDTLPKHHSQIFLDAIKYAKIQQIPREMEWTRIVDEEQKRCLQLGEVDTLTAGRSIQSLWTNELDSPLRRREFPSMRWNIVVWVTIAALVTLLCALWAKARRERLGALDRATERAGFTFIAPWLIGFIALTLGPMVVSLLLSFTKWSAMTPITDARSVGGANFHQLLTSDPTFGQSLKVTIYYVILAVPFSQLAALAVALLMNSRVRGIAIFRTIYFIPSLVVASTAGAVLWLQIYNNDYGILNAILRPVLGAIGKVPPDWFGRDARAWGVPAFVMMTIWGVGSAMILYLAGLKGIPASLYEAATVDGAGAARKLWNVTLPMLSPLIFYNIVMGIIGSFQVFTQAKVMTDGGPNNATLFYVLSLYRQAFEFHNMGYASAMAWVLFVIVLLLTLLVFRGSKNLVYYEGLKA